MLPGPALTDEVEDPDWLEMVIAFNAMVVFGDEVVVTLEAAFNKSQFEDAVGWISF